jgi:hypothetical protein
MKKTNKRSRHFELVMTEMEYDAFIEAYKNTLYRSKSEYARRLLLGKPVTILYRNRSLDEFIEAAVGIRKELTIVLSMDIFTHSEKGAFQAAVDRIMEELIKIIKQCSQI